MDEMNCNPAITLIQFEEPFKICRLGMFFVNTNFVTKF